MQENPQQTEDEISLKDLVDRIREIWSYLIKKWVIVLLAGMLGAGIGLAYAWLQPVKYLSRLSFVVEESKAGVGGLASLAGQFGFDISGGAGGSVFSGDNILLFLKSESLCRETLLTNYDSSGNELLCDRYADANGLKAAWKNNKEIGQINFARYRDGNLPRLEDSLMQVITKRILMKELGVGKPDKKASFIEVRVTMRDELLSKYFGERLVKIATGRYVESKTKLKSLNVSKLQRRADSLGALLNNRTYSAAANQQDLVDMNPALRMAPVAAEITSREKTMTATIFAEVVKNLEIAKVALNQETPTIEIVDRSSLPLRKEKTSKTVSLIMGGIVAGFFCIMVLLLKRWWKLQQKKDSLDRNGTSVELPVFVQRQKEKSDVENRG